MERTKFENFLISVAKKVEIKNLTQDKDWKESYGTEMMELLERAGFDPDSSIEEDFTSEENSVFFYFLTDDYLTVQESPFRGYLIPEGSVFVVGKDFVDQARNVWDCDVFEVGDELKISVTVINDKASSIDYYLRAFDTDKEPVVIELSDETLVDPDAIKEGYYDDKVISSEKEGIEISDADMDRALNDIDPLYL